MKKAIIIILSFIILLIIFYFKIKNDEFKALTYRKPIPEEVIAKTKLLSSDYWFTQTPTISFDYKYFYDYCKLPDSNSLLFYKELKGFLESLYEKNELISNMVENFGRKFFICQMVVIRNCSGIGYIGDTMIYSYENNLGEQITLTKNDIISHIRDFKNSSISHESIILFLTDVLNKMKMCNKDVDWYRDGIIN